MFYPEGLEDFTLEKSFIPRLPFFLLHRGVQKWLFAKYCPHFSFITLVKGIFFFLFFRFLGHSETFSVLVLQQERVGYGIEN